MTAASVNGARAIAVRLFIPWRGAWIADVDLDPDDAQTFPTGKVTLTIGDATLAGTVDDRNTGRFASSVHMRIVAGAGAWDKPVRPQPFFNDAGVSSRDVYEATAAELGETVNDPQPVVFGPYFVRSRDAGSRVFVDRDWYVDLAGVTQVGPRPTARLDNTLEVMTFDAQAQRLELARDAILLPGTVVTDTRFDGEVVVRDVEQTFTTSGARATAWTARTPTSRLFGALRSMVRELGGITYLRTYPYRFINDNGDRLNLQAIDSAPGLPDIIPIPVMPGMAGLSAKLTPSQTVRVIFLEGDPAQPIVVGFDENLPQEVTIDATDFVNLGGEDGAGVGRQGDPIVGYLPPELPVAGTVSGAPFVGTITIATPFIGIVLDGSQKVRSN